jgi:hypothetical protein
MFNGQIDSFYENANDIDIFFSPTYLIYEIYAYILCHIQCT